MLTVALSSLEFFQMLGFTGFFADLDMLRASVNTEPTGSQSVLVHGGIILPPYAPSLWDAIVFPSFDCFGMYDEMVYMK